MHLAKYNRLFKRFGAGLSLLSAFMFVAVATTSCIDDVFECAESEVEEYFPNADGFYGPFSLDIALDPEANGVKTRGTFETGNFKLNNAWVAMFDATTGELIAQSKREYNLGSGDFTNTDHNGGVNSGVTDDSQKYTVTLENLMFNDENEKVYIAGVGNYDGIEVIDAIGNPTDLESALDNVLNIKDYKNIAVNTGSAEAKLTARNENCPLIAGLWGSSHGNFTINNSGVVSSNTETNFSPTLFDKATKKVTSDFKTTISNGMIHMRRLYSHISVNVNVSAAGFEKFENPQVKIYNVPKYTFLQEHKTVENADEYNNDTWGAATHNAADLWSGNLSIEGSNTLNKTNRTINFKSSDNAAFCMNPEDEFTVAESGSKVSSIKFGYWHYESKRWGLSNVRTANDRERMHGASGVYSSLCPSENEDFNNNGTYFVVSADVKKGNYQGRADFIIHEGYCCKPNGDAADTEQNASRDFSTFRNCDYTYYIQINSMDNLTVKVEKDDLSDNFYHGTGGELYSNYVKDVKVAKAGNSYNISFPEGKLYWCIDNGGDIFGVKMDTDFPYSDKYSAYPAVSDPTTDFNDTFYDCITINGKKLGEVESFDSLTDCKIEFSNNSKYKGILYLCGILTSSDGLVKYYTVFKFDQDGTLLDAPVITMPYAVNQKNVIMGIDNHTLRWKKIEGATKYRISLRASGSMGGYSVTLAPGDGVNSTMTDASFISDASKAVPIKLVESGDYVEFCMRYANSIKSLLSFLQSDLSAEVTFEVTALGENGQQSDVSTFTTTITNPLWDFNTTAWRNAVGGLTKDATGLIENQTATVNGLNMFTGNSNKMTYLTYGSSGIYGFRPNGGGAKTNRCFNFHAFAPGKLTVWTSSQGNNVNQGRYVVAETDSGSKVQATDDCTVTAAGTLPAKGYTISNVDASNRTTTANSADNQSNIWIYATGDLIYYKIQFTPEDR